MMIMTTKTMLMAMMMILMMTVIMIPSLQWTPYIMEEVDKKGKTVYRGFSMDLLEILSKSLNFT